MRKGEKGGEEAQVWVSVHMSMEGGGDSLAGSSMILVQTPKWSPGARTIQDLSILRNSP